MDCPACHQSNDLPAWTGDQPCAGVGRFSLPALSGAATPARRERARYSSAFFAPAGTSTFAPAPRIVTTLVTLPSTSASPIRPCTRIVTSYFVSDPPLSTQNRALPPLAGRTAVIVDDGVATGATARAACLVVRACGAGRVVLAAPAAPRSAGRRIPG